MAKGEPKNEVRIDKWLWAVRLFKTRSIAIEACKKGRITIKGVTIKPSRMIKVGDIIEVRRPPVTYSFEVLNLSENRMGAKLVPEFMKDVTLPSQLEILEMSKVSGFVDRARGTGRPTKKDRRELDQFAEDYSFFDDWNLDED
jgi:ribosome-associated heat shock protein Hsp15